MNVLSLQAGDPKVAVPEPFSVSAAVSLQERRYRTLKSGDTFGVFDHSGAIISQPGLLGKGHYPKWLGVWIGVEQGSSLFGLVRAGRERVACVDIG